jgi:hypothetical protein
MDIMVDSAQRATLVLEHIGAVGEEGPEEEELLDRPWSVVAYLISDGGQRQRSTLCRCRTREEAASALEETWRGVVASKGRL